MREALAGTNHDFLLRDGSCAGETGNAKRRKQRPAFFRLRFFQWRPKARTLVLLGFALIAIIGVPLNALFLQDGRHPAPLFGAPPHATTAERAPLPPPRPAAVASAPKTPAAKAEPAKPEDAPAAVVAHPAEKPHDAIGALLSGGAPKSEEVSEKKALFVQRALLKLGYVVRPDGKFGGSTRQALEKFERDSGLPVKGEVTAKILRQLSARSGLAVE